MGSAQDKQQTVEVNRSGLGEFILTGTQTFLLMAGVTFVLLYFLLASGNLFQLKLVRVLPMLEDKKRAVEICRELEQDISKYLWTVTLINIGLGVVIAVAMYLLGMPNPARWGAMATILNYIPYLGAFAGIVIVGVTATLTFDQVSFILLAPSVYFLCQVLEASFVTPMALGRSLALNPVVIFIWLIFWGWIWGIAGALLAVPLLAILKIICRHFEALSAVGEFLEGESNRATLP